VPPPGQSCGSVRPASGEGAPALPEGGSDSALPLDAFPSRLDSRLGRGTEGCGPGRIEPLSPGRMHVGFTCDEEVVRLLERAREILRHKHPAGRLEDVVKEIAGAFLAQSDPDAKMSRVRTDSAREVRSAARRRPRAERAGRSAASASVAATRRVPIGIRAQVWARDSGRCSFAASDGRRCPATARLEFDHIVPWALGGRSDSPANLRLLCRAHNLLAGRSLFSIERAGCRGPAESGIPPSFGEGGGVERRQPRGSGGGG